MDSQLDVVSGERDMGGTMRLGLYPADLLEGSLARETYGLARVDERHRHRYEVNNTYRGQLEAAGLVFSGLSPDGTLVEYVELPREKPTPTTSARRRTPSCARGRRGRTRCSSASSRPRCSARPRPGSSFPVEHPVVSLPS